MFLLLAEELPHARLPAAALVQGDASVLGAAPREPGALPSQDVHELLLGQALHLARHVFSVAGRHLTECCKNIYGWSVALTCFMSSS